MAALLGGRALRGTSRWPTTGMWRAARPKDEVGTRPRLHGEQAAALAVDEQPAVEALVRLDVTARIGAAAPATRDLGPARAEAHGVVARHSAPVAAAQDVGQVGGRPPPGRRGLRGRMGEAGIEVGEERGEEGVGGLEGREAAECQGSPHSEPPGSGKQSHPGSPIWSQAGSPMLSHPGAGIVSHPAGRDRISFAYPQPPCVAVGNKFVAGGDARGWTEESGDRHSRVASPSAVGRA